MMDGSESDNSKSKLISFEELVKSPILCLENTVKTIVLRVNNLVRQKLAFTNFLLAVQPSHLGPWRGWLVSFCPWGEGALANSSKCTLQFDTSASNYKLIDPFME
jgi:hypothetical protein